MGNYYRCPECDSSLNIGNRLALSVGVEGGKRGIFLFVIEPNSHCIVAFDMNTFIYGKALEIYCPLCFASLTSKKHPNLAKVLLSEDNDKECELFFSRVMGEKATYKVGEQGVECYGEQQDIYKGKL